MIELCREEMGHFQMVHDFIKVRGLDLGKQRPYEYVKRLNSFFEKGGSPQQRLVQELLITALMEARSCERFRALSEHWADEKLAAFYPDLMVSEANH